VAWIDGTARGSSLGRSLVQLGEHITAAELNGLDPTPRQSSGRRDKAVVFEMPSWLLNRPVLTVFNALYRGRSWMNRGMRRIIHWDRFLFPLDSLVDWNKLYGRRGFLQHPRSVAPATISSLLERISGKGYAPILITLKELASGSGLMSFPLPGYTLAVDFPATTHHFELLDELDEIVVAAGGRLYLAKDSRQKPSTFEAGYPALGQFRAIRRYFGCEKRLESRLSVRLKI
jgi:decaprenylphospho-beta-D-ribofuranose 2-oxidase